MLKALGCCIKHGPVRHLEIRACVKLFSSKSTSDAHEPKFNIRKENPLQRSWNVILNDFRNVAKGKFSVAEDELFPSYCDVVIVGGGAMGSSVAYWLKQRATEGLKIVVVERDPTYTRASTVLSLGGVRQQFSVPENIQMSMYSSEFLRNIKRHLSVLDMDPPDINFNPHGYLFLASEAGAEQLQLNYKLQRELGAEVELLNTRQLKEVFPWLNTQGIVLGCHGVGNEGWFDPWCLLTAFKRKATSLGAIYLKAEALGFQYKVSDEYFVKDENSNEHPVEYPDTLVVKMENGEHRPIKFALAIIAAGCYSGEVAKMAKIGSGPNILKVPLPVEPRKRYVYVVHNPKGPGLDCPLLIDSSGVYMRREGLGGLYLCGRSPLSNEEPDITNLDVDYAFFENQVWPHLANRIPCFECIKLKSAWAGFYDYNTFDQNGVIGVHPYYPNLFFATGFSGHGIQQSPAVGRAIAELLLDGEYKTIDLSRFGFDRLVDRKPIFEKNVV